MICNLCNSCCFDVILIWIHSAVHDVGIKPGKSELPRYSLWSRWSWTSHCWCRQNNTCFFCSTNLLTFNRNVTGLVLLLGIAKSRNESSPEVALWDHTISEKYHNRRPCFLLRHLFEKLIKIDSEPQPFASWVSAVFCCSMTLKFHQPLAVIASPKKWLPS